MLPQFPSDNDSGWLSASPYWVKLDNAERRDRTIYGWVKDAAGKVSSSAAMDNITFDNVTLVIDNLTWDNNTASSRLPGQQITKQEFQFTCTPM